MINIRLNYYIFIANEEAKEATRFINETTILHKPTTEHCSIILIISSKETQSAIGASLQKR